MTIHEVKQAVFATIQSSTETELPITENTHLIREIGLSSVSYTHLTLPTIITV